MLHELPLVIFTLLEQAAIGAFVIGGLIILFNCLNEYEVITAAKYYFFILVLMGLGVLASIFHLGTPARAFNALNQFGHAWMSNEIGMTILFISMGGLFWLLALFSPRSFAFPGFFLVLTMIAGILLLTAMINVYMIDTVPSWYTVYTPFSFVATVLILGSILSLWLLKLIYVPQRVTTTVHVLGLISLAVGLLIAVMQMNYWLNLQSSVASLSQILHSVYPLFIGRIAIMVLALVLWATSAFKDKICLYNLLFVTLLLFIAEFAGRLLFYTAHITVGLV